MQGLQANAPPQGGEAAPAGWRRDLGLLAGLLVLAVTLRGWLLCHTEVAARDSIGFIRYALQFEGQARPPEFQIKTWGDVIRHNHQHPGYPLTILAMSLPVRHFFDGTTADAMRLSAQLASALAAVLLVIPMFYLGKILFDRGIGFWAALLFQCLPVSGHILSDGLSEALFLLLTATTLVCAAHAVRGNSWARFALCGAGCGLTYLVRPEGGLLLVATGLVLLVMQLPGWRRPRRTFMACGASLALAAATVGSPYVIITGHLTNKPSVSIMVGTYPKEAGKANGQSSLPAASPVASCRRPLLASILGVTLVPDYQKQDGPLSQRLGKGLFALAEELVRGFHYLAGIPALLGMWWFAERMRRIPGFWVVLALCGLHLLVLWRLAVVVGYVSERHIQILILAGCYPAVGFLREFPSWLARRLGGNGAGEVLGRAARLATGASVLSLLLLLGLIGVCLPKTLQTLHANRAGYHAAGQWLAGRVVHCLDLVEDRHCWAHYYAGEVFEEGKKRVEQPGVCYVVVGRHKDSDGGLTAPDVDVNVRAGGRIVYHWPPQRPTETADVIVYAVPYIPAGARLATP